MVPSPKSSIFPQFLIQSAPCGGVFSLEPRVRPISDEYLNFTAHAHFTLFISIIPDEQRPIDKQLLITINHYSSKWLIFEKKKIKNWLNKFCDWNLFIEIIFIILDVGESLWRTHWYFGSRSLTIFAEHFWCLDFKRGRWLRFSWEKISWKHMLGLVTLNFSFTEIPTSFYEKSDQLIGFCVLELV